MSHRITEITMVAPPSKLLNDVSKNVSQVVWSLSCTEVIKLRQRAPITQPNVWTGDLTNRTSESKPITSEPMIPPTEPNEVILPAWSFEYPSSS